MVRSAPARSAREIACRHSGTDHRQHDAIAGAVVATWFTAAYLAHPEIRKEWAAAIGATPAEGHASCCEAVAAMDLRLDLPRIMAATLAIAGADDPTTGRAVLQTIAEDVQDGRLLVVPSAAHLVNVERADLVTAAIIDHLTTQP